MEDDGFVLFENREEGIESRVERVCREVDGAWYEGDLHGVKMVVKTRGYELQLPLLTSKSVRLTSTTKKSLLAPSKREANIFSLNSVGVITPLDVLEGAGKASCQFGVAVTAAAAVELTGTDILRVERWEKSRSGRSIRRTAGN